MQVVLLFFFVMFLAGMRRHSTDRTDRILVSTGCLLVAVALLSHRLA